MTSSSSAGCRSPFQVGSLVEFRSNEIGFSTAWFEGTVIGKQSKHRSYIVAYPSFVAGAASTCNERVFHNLLRPRPPPTPPPPAVFRLHECVEAFQYGVWWKGVVSKLPAGVDGDGLYSVCFPASREEFQFKVEDMRKRMEWANGDWLPVEDEDVECVMFSEGMRVEVSRDKEHYGAVWFAGTVLKVIGKIYFLVEYENLRVNGNNHTEILLKEIVDIQYIRPSPPSFESTSFNVLDEVEGFHRDGWFVGIVSMMLSGSRYMVNYKHQKEEVVLDRASMRPCLVWIDGHWVHSSQAQHGKHPTLRETKSPVSRWCSSASKRTSHPISLLTTSDNVVDVAEEPKLSNLKRGIADGPDQGLVESSLASNKSKKANLLLNDMSQDKGDSMSIPVPSVKDNGGEIADSSEAMNLNGKGAVSPSLGCGIKLSQPCRKLKKGNMLGEHLQLFDEIQSVTRRTSARNQTSLPNPVLSSSNDDGEVSAISGVLNSKDDSSQTSKKPRNGNSLEEHLQPVHGFLKECHTRSVEGTECQPKEVNSVQSPVANKHVDVVPTFYCGNGSTVNAGIRRKKLAVRTRRRPVKTPNVLDLKHPVLETIKEHKGTIAPKKITFTNSMESKQLSKNDRVLENRNSLPTVSTEENSPVNDYTSLSGKQVDMVEDAHAVPCIESSTLNTKLLEYEMVLHQSQALNSSLDNWNCTDRLAEARAEAQHQACPSISSGLPSDNVVEVVKVPADSAPIGSSPSEYINVCDENEFNPSMFVAENAFVEAGDRAPLHPSPSEPSLLGEAVVDHNEVNPCWSLSGRPVEIEQVPCDPTPCQSSVMSCSFINKCREIQSCIDELGENGRKRENQALPAGSEKDIAPDGDSLASTGPQTGQDIVEDEEMTLLGPSTTELPYKNSVWPFTKRSEFWDLVEAKEAFRLLPQKPHFRPLLQYAKEFREGMAIGLMVSFIHLVTDLCSLRIADSHEEFEEKLKALGPLEENGFNIQPVRDRLERLLELRTTLTQSEAKKQLLGGNVAKLEKEKHQNHLLLLSVEKCMLVLEQNLARVKERRASVLLDIGKNDSELASLQEDVQAAEEAIVSAERQFSTALAAPW